MRWSAQLFGLGHTIARLPWRKLVFRTRGEFFRVACLAGIVPAFATATIPTSAYLMGTIDFHLLSIEMNVFVRVAALAVLALAIWLAFGLHRKLVSFWYLLPLFLFIVTPRADFGAALPYELWKPDSDLREPFGLPAFVGSQKIHEIDNLWDVYLASLPPSPSGATKSPAREKLASVVEKTNTDKKRPMADLSSMVSQALAIIGAPGLRIPSLEAMAERRNDPVEQIHNQFKEYWLDEKRALYVDALYLIVSLAVLVHFVWKYGVLNWPFATFVSASSFVSALLARSAWSSDWLGHAVVASYPILVGLLTLLLVRLLARMYLDNKGYFTDVKRSERSRTLLGAFLYWLPFPIVVIAIYFAGKGLGAYVENALYCQDRPPLGADTDFTSCTERGVFAVRDSNPAEDTLREDLQVTATVALQDIKNKLIVAHAKAEEAEKKGLGAADAIAKEFDEVVKEHVYDYDEYKLEKTYMGVLPPSHAIRNLAKKYIADPPYRKIRNEFREIILAPARRLDRAAKEGAVDGKNSLDKIVSDFDKDWIPSGRRQVDFWLVVGAGLAVWGVALSFVWALRGFSTLLARRAPMTALEKYTVISHEAPALKNTEPNKASLILPLIEDDELKLTFFAGKEAFLARRDVELKNSPPATTAFPFAPLHWVPGRLFSGSYFTKEVNKEQKDFQVTLSPLIARGLTLDPYAWRLSTGSEVAFRWKDFVAASSMVTFRTRYSLRLPMSVLMRIRFSVARGPGFLILRAPGRLDISKDGMSPGRLASWSLRSRFHITSARGIFRAYADSPQIAVHADDPAVFEAQTVYNTRNVGVIRLMFRLLTHW